MFELDVQETEGPPAGPDARHDAGPHHRRRSRSSLTGRRGGSATSPWRRSAKLDAGSWFAAKTRASRCPPLRETLHAMGGSGLGLLLEIKAPALYRGSRPASPTNCGATPRGEPVVHRAVVRLGLDADLPPGPCPRCPSACSARRRSRELPELAEFAGQINPPYGDLTREYVRRVHDLDMEVFAWTVDNPATMRRLISYGVDGIITNRPGRVQRAVNVVRPSPDRGW